MIHGPWIKLTAKYGYDEPKEGGRSKAIWVNMAKVQFIQLAWDAEKKPYSVLGLDDDETALYVEEDPATILTMAKVEATQDTQDHAEAALLQFAPFIEQQLKAITKALDRIDSTLDRVNDTLEMLA